MTYTYTLYGVPDVISRMRAEPWLELSDQQTNGSSKAAYFDGLTFYHSPIFRSHYERASLAIVILISSMAEPTNILCINGYVVPEIQECLDRGSVCLRPIHKKYLVRNGDPRSLHYTILRDQFTTGQDLSHTEEYMVRIVC